MLIKAMISFPTLFTAKAPKGSNTPRFDAVFLLPPDDPQAGTLYQMVEQAKADTFPSGFPQKGDLCFGRYEDKYQGRDYYDPRLNGWWVLTATAKAEDRPPVVDMNRQPVIDPAQVYSGAMVWANVGISGYTKGTGGVGGWLNGVMVIGEEGPFGRLDGRPTVDQMFAEVGGGAPAPSAPSAPGAPAAPTPPTAPQAPAPAAPTPPAPAAPTPPAATAPPPAPPQPAAPPAPAAPARQMTPAATATYEAYREAGWTDEALIQNGLMLPPGGVTPSFM